MLGGTFWEKAFPARHLLFLQYDPAVIPEEVAMVDSSPEAGKRSRLSTR